MEALRSTQLKMFFKLNNRLAVYLVIDAWQFI